MKRALLGLLLVTFATALFAAAQPVTGVVGTYHDLSFTGYKTVTNAQQVCIFCHIPHEAVGSVSGGNIDAQLIPLWNHATSGATFTMYNQTNNPISELQGTVDSGPTGSSLACLSCHDGTLAVGQGVNFSYGWPGSGGSAGALSYATNTSTWLDATGHAVAGSPIMISTDLTNDHPIAITYRDDLDTGLKPAVGLTKVRLFGPGGNVTGSKVQCASCHDPHNLGTRPGNGPFLRDTMIGSAMCLDCHNK